MCPRIVKNGRQLGSGRSRGASLSPPRRISCGCSTLISTRPRSRRRLSFGERSEPLWSVRRRAERRGDWRSRPLPVTLTTTASRSIPGSRHRLWLRTPNAGEVRICLFSAVESDWQEAGKSLDQARRDYDQAIANAGKIRAALRDPRSRPGGITGLFPLASVLRSGNRRRPHDSLVLDLWDKTHALSDLLEPENGTDLTRLPDIQRRADGAQEGFPGTGGSVSKACREPGEHPTRAGLGSRGRRRRGRVPR